MQGKLIVFEGVEGCGKSTQLQGLKDWLSNHCQFQKLQAQSLVREIVLTREPGGTSLGSSLRTLLLVQDQSFTLANKTELLLYAADRAQHVEEVVRPALAQGHWVLCDRYVDSTVAYQGYGRGLDLALIHQLNDIATGGLVPDLTLWLKLDAAVGLARTQKRGAADRMEQSGLAFHHRVQQGFEQLAQEHPERIVAIAADADVATVSQSIQAVIEQSLSQWYGLI